MAETKRNRNAQAVETQGGFQISRNPLVQISAADEGYDVPDGARLPSEYGAQILFAIARDPRTIFVSWKIDWLALFEKVAPRDRQVHLRVHRAEDREQETVAVEPLAAMHYHTTSGTHSSYRVEIGYYDAADVWHSVAMSHEIVMPPDDIAEIADADLATIPFHVGFQQLLNFFGPSNGTALATVVSQFQKRVLSSEPPKALNGEEKRIFRELNASAPEIAAGWRAFDEIDGEKLARRTRALVGFGSTSPSRGFEGEWASAGS